MTEIIIKKSKFCGYCFNLQQFSDIDKYINDVKAVNKKASHVCYAYSFFGDVLHVKAFDDKEPSKTAGRPILGIIEKKNLKNILIIVVRYYGGIKLGAGGLVRAYSKCAVDSYDSFING